MTLILPADCVGMLDNGMSKIVIPADIRSFFESKPQQGLVSKLADDGFVSKKTVKYLKGLFYAYNDKAEHKEGMGLPRVQYKEKRVCLV